MSDDRQPKISISKGLVVLNSSSSVLTRIINLTVIVWVYQHLLNRISVEEFAVYPVVTAVMVFAPLFFSVLTGGISRHIIDAYARGDGQDIGRIISSILPIIALMAVGFLILGAGFTMNVEHILNIPAHMEDEARIMLGLLIASFAAQMIALPFSTGFHIRQRFVELNLLMLAREIFRMALLLTLILGLEPRVIWVVLATVIAENVFQIILIIRSRHLVPELRFDRRLYDRDRAKSLISFGLWTTLGQLGTIMYTHAATLILNIYGTATDVTCYFIGTMLFRHLDGLILTAVIPLQPVITAMNATGDRKRLAATLLKGGRLGLWVSLAAATPAIIYAGDFVNLYLGPEYSDAAVVIILLMMIFPFSQATSLLPTAAIAMAEVRALFLPAFLFQLAGFVLMMTFAAGFGLGAIGVTLSLTIITIVSQLGYFWRLTFRLTDARPNDFVRDVLMRGWTPAIAAGVVWFVLSQINPAASWLILGVNGVIGGLAYVAVLLIFCLATDDRNDARRVVKWAQGFMAGSARG